ncbi:hypothetical protein RB195_009882 [Necator americanus]|uniref:Uncharacterized protein n=1 Tax=Necator americanus TaxID=51031 RepID=A0ABR1CYN7_NECAM
MLTNMSSTTVYRLKVKVTLGVELRCTAEVRPPAGSPRLRRSSRHPTFRLLGIGSLAKSKPLLRITTVLAKCRDGDCMYDVWRLARGDQISGCSGHL